MIIGESFVWAHLPKAAGDATFRMFTFFPELVLYSDQFASGDKHVTFAARRTHTIGKTRVMNLRRLPSWMLSYSVHKSRYGLAPDFEPQAMESPEEMATSPAADAHLGLYLAGGEPIDDWFRVESLATDFLAFVEKLTTVDDARRAQVIGLAPLNQGKYDHDPLHWFGDELLGRLYKTNPLWAETERLVYGDTLADRR